MAVHPSAIVDPAARVHPTAEIGPYCIVNAGVEIGAGTRLMAHIYVDGDTVIGEENIFYPYASIGVAPQDLKYHGEPSRTRIGDRNKIREFVTVHRGTEGGRMLTEVGSDTLLSAYSHVAHDCHVGSHVVMSHGATLGGHVTVGDWAVVGAYTGVHQFCQIGRHSITGGYSVITQDVMPFSNTVSAREVKVFGANRIGLERRGFETASIESLQTAIRLLTRAKLNTTQAIEKIQSEVPPCPELDELIAFIRASERGVIK